MVQDRYFKMKRLFLQYKTRQGQVEAQKEAELDVDTNNSNPVVEATMQFHLSQESSTSVVSNNRNTKTNNKDNTVSGIASSRQEIDPGNTVTPSITTCRCLGLLRSAEFDKEPKIIILKQDNIYFGRILVLPDNTDQKVNICRVNGDHTGNKCVGDSFSFGF